MELTLAELRALVPARGPSVARIPPGRRADVGTLNWTIAAIGGRVAGTGPMHIFTTLGRHRWLFRRWLVFAGALMPGGKLPREDTELVILRVAANTGSHYEWHQHVLLGMRSGLTAAQVAAAAEEGPLSGAFSPRQEALLRCADELHAAHQLSDETFADLRTHLGERDTIELLMLVGAYEGLAMTLNGLGVQTEQER